MVRTTCGKTSLFRRFATARQGSAAVEFAMVATPFLALMFGVLELGLVFMVSTTLDNAVDAASRKIRTGELQTAGGTAETFKTAVCDEMAYLGASCSANVHVDVRTFPKFADVAITDPTTDGAFDETKTTFAPGSSESIVLVRVYYEWTLITPMLNQGLESLSGGKRLIAATATFRNEPFG